jgi:hypothetical protein
MTPVHQHRLAPTPLAREVRGTLIVSSLQMLRERGLFDRYRRFVEPAVLPAIEAVVAPTWAPVDLIVAHYRACDQLGFTVHELVDLGRGLTRRLHRPVLKVMLSLAGAAGVTPWTLAPQLPKIWGRMYRGGAIETIAVGPKDARVEIRGFPCAGIPYSRIAWRGVLLGGVELFASRAYVSEIPDGCDATSLSYRVSWA